MPKFKAIALILLGSLIWSLTMVKSGINYGYGIGFWGANGHDGIWHLAIIRSLARNTLEMPIFSGEAIKNYHLGFDVLLALVSKIGIPASMLYFQIVPPILALALGTLVYSWVKKWQDEQAALWAVFFVYFGGSWSWVLGKGESTFWSQQSISTLINPPYALSLVLLVLILKILPSSKKLWSKLFWLEVGLFAILPSIKIYAGILAFVALGILAVKNKSYRALLIISGLLAFAIFWPVNKGASNLLIYQPGWFLETLVNLSDRLYIPRLYYWMKSDFFVKKILGYAIGLAIFVLGNLGVRVIAFKEHKLDEYSIFAYVSMVLGLIFPMIFVQSGTAWNTIQFFYYFLFFASVLAGVAVSKILHKTPSNFTKILVAAVFVILTIPTTWQSLPNYLPNRPPAMVSKTELEALDFLQNQSQGVVLTPVFDEDAAKAAESHPPRPLYLYVSSAYVSAYANKPVYLEDEVNLNITGYRWDLRRQEVLNFFKTKDLTQARKFLTDNRIQYIYLPQVSKVRPVLSESQLGFKNVFENSQVAIWEMIK